MLLAAMRRCPSNAAWPEPTRTTSQGGVCPAPMLNCICRPVLSQHTQKTRRYTAQAGCLACFAVPPGMHTAGCVLEKWQAKPPSNLNFIINMYALPCKAWRAQDSEDFLPGCSCFPCKHRYPRYRRLEGAVVLTCHLRLRQRLTLAIFHHSLQHWLYKQAGRPQSQCTLVARLTSDTGLCVGSRSEHSGHGIYIKMAGRA